LERLLEHQLLEGLRPYDQARLPKGDF
jgi:hypothetical protein